MHHDQSSNMAIQRHITTMLCIPTKWRRDVMSIDMVETRTKKNNS